MEISADKVKKLRDLTGAGMMDCKAALQEAAGEVDQAITILRKRESPLLQKKPDALRPKGS